MLLTFVALIAVAGIAAGLLSSKALSEKMVAAGMLPRTFLGFVPVLQVVIRVFGAGLIFAGAISMGIEAGWINRDILDKYAFSGVAILIGLVLLFLSPRKSA